MSHDVFTRESICYLDEVNTVGTANSLLYSAYRMFIKAYRVQNFAEIKQHILTREAFSSSFNFQFADEILLDSIKISICFENYMKAELLLSGFIIHRLQTRPSQFRQLHHLQETTPISIAEVRSIQAYVYDETRQMNYLPGVSPYTLDYNWLLTKEGYIYVHNVPLDILTLLQGYNSLRNTLHFLGSHGDRYDQSLIDNTEMLINFVEENIRVKNNALAIARDMPRLVI